LNIVSYPIGDEDGMLAALQDISERKKTEKALMESEQRLSYIINFLPDATFAINTEGRIIVWNRAIEQMTGVSSVQVLGKGNYEHAVHFYGKRRPVLADLVLKPDREIEKTYTFITREMDCLIAEPLSPVTILGQAKYLWAKASPMYDADGNIIGAIESIRDITKRKTVEETLKKSEQTVQILLNANPETELLVDNKGVILAGNNTLAKRIGKDICDLIGRSFSDVLPPEVAKTRDVKIKETIETGQLVHFTDSRGDITFDNYHYPVFDENGNVEMVAIFAMDITDRIKAEEALRESEERYRTAIEYSNDGVAIIRGGTHVYVNRKLVEMFGYDDAQEIVGKTHVVTVHSDDLERVSDINRRRQRGETVPLHYEFKGIKKNGDIIYIEASSTNTQYQGESVSLAYLRDITDRKLSSDALRDSEIKYHTLLDNVNDAIFLMLKDIFIDCNEKALFIFGCTREDIIGKTPWKFSPPTQPDGKNSQEKAMEIIRMTLSSKTQFFEWKHSKLDGTLFDAEVSLNSIEFGGKTYIQVIVRDITQRKQYDQSLKMSLAKLRKATGGIIDVIVMAVEMRDPYTAGHQKRVASLARSIAKEMGLTEESVDRIRMAGIIHDLGKISIPAEILTRPRKLTETEYDLVKTHPQIGYDILKDIAFPWPIAQIVHQHHERLNGTGYPKGLKQADILLEARIIAVCDVVESMASHRPYRPALGIDMALEEIIKNKGILYDAEVVDTCVRLFIKKGFSFD
jgi:PAS domain S-box-containing protein/putative nucleotidyltransferase with HDIG domain